MSAPPPENGGAVAPPPENGGAVAPPSENGGAVAPPWTDAEARRAIREDLGDTLIVEAAAGTGKTTALVGRIAALLARGESTLARVVAVTFTEKAAGELKLRLRGEIERARTERERGTAERAHLDRALAELELAHIGTIHSFCADLLRERPIEAGIDPLFEVMAQDEQDRLLESVFTQWFERVLDAPPEGVRRVLRRRPRGPGAGGPRDDLRHAAAALLEQRDFTAAWRREPFDRAARTEATLQRLREVAALADRASSRDDYLAQNLAEIGRFLSELDHREAVRDRDLDGLEAELRELSRSRFVHWHWRGSPRRPYGPGLERASVIALRDEARQSLLDWIADCDADLAPLLQRELAEVCDAYEAAKRRSGRLDFLDLLLLARNLVRDDAAAAHALRERFTHFFVDEFQDTDPLQAELLMRLAAVDGADATADWTALEPHPGRLFLVGDPKQSIYRFRRADVELYERIAQALVARGARRLELTTSFRSVPGIQSAVNAAFEGPMREGAPGRQARHVPLTPFRPEPEGAAPPPVIALPVPRPYGDYGTITRWRIEDSLPDAVGAFVDWLTTRSGWTIEDPGGTGEHVPIAPRHVCLLLRRFRRFRDDVTRPYVRSLEVRRVPHVLVGGRSFHDREEVLALRNALVAIEWPEDELRVFAALRGPLFSLSDDALLAYRHRHGRLHPLAPRSAADPKPRSATPPPQAPEARAQQATGERGAADPAALARDAEDEVADALELLRELHFSRNRRAIASTVCDLLERVRAHAGIAIWPTGEQALANCLRVVDLARRFERGGAPSFRAFVERLEGDAEAGETEEAPAVEEGTEGVRIMTVHRAKGLEFPVVILVDPTCRATRETPTRHIDPQRGLCAQPLCGSSPRELLERTDHELERDAAEAVRLTYVAATRARDLLVVPVLGDAWTPNGRPVGLSSAELTAGAAPGSAEALPPDAGWLDVLRPALVPARARRREPRHPGPGNAGPGGWASLPEFRGESVLERPSRSRQPRDAAVLPGLHTPELGAHAVLWWDPHALELDRSWTVGLRQQRILEADAGEVASARGEAEHRAWLDERARRLREGGAPSRRVATATAWAAAHSESGAPAADVPVEVVALDRSARPGGRRFGSLVHAVLASLDLGAQGDAVRRTARAQGRLLGASDAEVEAAAEAAQCALAHPLLQRAAQSEQLRREVAVLWPRPDGVLIEGVVDLAFREAVEGEPRWTVVDFKTDRDLDAQRSAYAAQVQLYAEAIHAATGEPTAPVLLVV